MSDLNSQNVKLTKRTTLVYFLATFVVSGFLLVSVVLPAEYGIDPIGTGSLLGITGMSSDRPFIAVNADTEPHTHTYFLPLDPFESVEIKYEMKEGSALLYDWYATDELLYELHSHPIDAAPGFADSFDRAHQTKRAGVYIAPYDGLHGWFWENRGTTSVLLTLKNTGFYDNIYEFKYGQRQLIYSRTQ